MNQDSRPLPYGFVQRFDSNHQRWYYVNALANPPISSWLHPADEFRNGPPNSYQSPSYHGAPPHAQPYVGSGHYDSHGGHGGHGDHHKKSGGGMGTAAAVGVGAAAGVVGGVLIADAINDAQEEAYQEGFEAGGGGDESD